MNRLAAILILAALVLPARANEALLSLHARIEIARNGELKVSETIKVRAASRRIHHGIYREFPTRYPHPRLTGIWQPLAVHRVPWELVSATRDGQPEPWHREKLDNGVRVYLGSEDRILDPGVYEYELVYRTSRQIRHGSSRDRLVWNVTGNGWEFEILHASAELVFPGPVANATLDGWTGPQGSTERAMEIRKLDDRRYLWTATRSLQPREGLTISAAWPAGLLETPGPLRHVAWHAGDWRESLIAFLSLGGALCLLYFSWRRHGVDPRRRELPAGPRIPDDLPAAVLRHVQGLGNDSRGFTATLLSLAQSGHLAFSASETPGHWTISRADTPDPAGPVERAALSLFDDGRTVVDTSSARDRGTFINALRRHQRSVGQAAGVGTQTNARALVWPGLLLVAANVLLCLDTTMPWPMALVLPFMIIAINVPVFVFASMLVSELRPGPFPRSRGLMVISILMTLLFVGLTGGLLWAFWTASIPWPGLHATASALLLVLFRNLLRRPGAELQRLRDEIRALARHLESLPGDDHDLLPFAVAFGLEKNMRTQVSTMPAAPPAPDPMGTKPPYYVFWDRSLAPALASSLPSAVSAAAAAPSGSGGTSSGSGSSGSGGGGGGGGGW